MLSDNIILSALIIMLSDNMVSSNAILKADNILYDYILLPDKHHGIR
jgi:hypothetical protein